jgi:hypothetical protein
MRRAVTEEARVTLMEICVVGLSPLLLQEERWTDWWALARVNKHLYLTLPSLGWKHAVSHPLRFRPANDHYGFSSITAALMRTALAETHDAAPVISIFRLAADYGNGRYYKCLAASLIMRADGPDFLGRAGATEKEALAFHALALVMRISGPTYMKLCVQLHRTDLAVSWARRFQCRLPIRVILDDIYEVGLNEHNRALLEIAREALPITAVPVIPSMFRFIYAATGTKVLTNDDYDVIASHCIPVPDGIVRDYPTVTVTWHGSRLMRMMKAVSTIWPKSNVDSMRYSFLVDECTIAFDGADVAPLRAWESLLWPLDGFVQEILIAAKQRPALIERLKRLGFKASPNDLASVGILRTHALWPTFCSEVISQEDAQLIAVAIKTVPALDKLQISADELRGLVNALTEKSA